MTGLLSDPPRVTGLMSDPPRKNVSSASPLLMSMTAAGGSPGGRPPSRHAPENGRHCKTREVHADKAPAHRRHGPAEGRGAGDARAPRPDTPERLTEARPTEAITAARALAAEGGRHPLLTRWMTEPSGVSADEQFETAVGFLIDGFATRLPDTARRPVPRR